MSEGKSTTGSQVGEAKFLSDKEEISDNCE